MLYYYIISIQPTTAADVGYKNDDKYYKPAAYYADRVMNSHFEYDRPFDDFTTIADFKSETRDWCVSASYPSALLTIKYERDTNEYTAIDLYIINSFDADTTFHFKTPVKLDDLGLAHEAHRPRF